MFFLCGGGGQPACPASPATVTGTVTAANVIGPAGQGVAPGEFQEAIDAMRDWERLRECSYRCCIRLAKFEDRSTKSNSNAILQHKSH